MKYNGKIKEVNHIVISDPSYGQDVSCRYDKNEINGKNWNVNISISEISVPMFDEINLQGIQFFVLLSKENEIKELDDNGSFAFHKRNKINDYEIGIDTACVSIGLNEFADEINNSGELYLTDMSLNTLSDGMFGTVKEGINNGEVNFVWISGFLDEDTGYSIEDIIRYLEYQLKIENLELEIEDEEECL